MINLIFNKIFSFNSATFKKGADPVGEVAKDRFEKTRYDAPSLQDRVWRAFKNFILIKSIVKVFKAVFARPETEVKVSDDGNCLFHSVAYLLSQRGISKSHHALRQEAVDYMQRHYQTDRLLNDFIKDAIYSYNKKLQDERAELEATNALLLGEGQLAMPLSEEKEITTPEAYFERANQPRFYANVAELYALGQLYNTNFTVHVNHLEQTVPLENKDYKGHLKFAAKHFEPLVP